MPPNERLKHLTFELLDIGLHGDSTGLSYVKETPLYKMTDKYIGYDQKFEAAKDKSIQAYHFFNDKVYSPVKDNFFVLYDSSANYLSFVVKVISEHWRDHHAKIIAYVREHYENVSVFVCKTWLRLDFNNDGQVTAEDVK